MSFLDLELAASLIKGAHGHEFLPTVGHEEYLSTADGFPHVILDHHVTLFLDHVSTISNTHSKIDVADRIWQEVIDVIGNEPVCPCIGAPPKSSRSRGISLSYQVGFHKTWLNRSRRRLADQEEEEEACKEHTDGEGMHFGALHHILGHVDRGENDAKK